jgi:hypothetical protein
MKLMILLISNQYFPSLSGAQSVLQMVVSPEAIVKSFEYRLKDIAFSSFQLLLDFISSGAQPALPMGVAPEAIRGMLATFYRLKYLLHTTFSFPSESP